MRTGLLLRPHGQENRLRTEPPDRGHRHGAVDAERTGLVRGGADHAPTADDNRPATKLGPVVLLDGRIECVHVDMQDGKLSLRHGARSHPRKQIAAQFASVC